MSLSKIKDVDTRTKEIIFRYSRRYETQFRINIPVMIQYIIIGYYWIYDKFTIYGDDMTLFNAPKIGVKKTNHQLQATSFWRHLLASIYNTAYGDNIINIDDTSISQYKWSLRFEREGWKAMFIGIGSSDGEKKIDNYTALLSSYHPIIDHCSDHQQFLDRGIVHLKLDISQKQLCYSLNDGKNAYIIANNLDLENEQFRLAVAMEYGEIELVAFSITHK